LKQSLAGWKVTIFDGADANGDNTLSNMDVTLIKQHLAGWKVTLGKTNSSGDNKNDELDDGDNNDDDDDLDIGGGDIIDDGDDGDDEIDDGDDEIDTGDDDLPDNSFDDYAEEMLVMINAARTEAGLSPLQLSTELCRAANIRSVELVTSFSHTRPNGENPSSVLAEINYPGSSGCAENIAAGQNSVSAAFTGWMNSQGHYENIMDPDNKFIGIGYYYYADSQYKHHWTQLFTSVDSAVTDDYADEILTKINAERAIVGAPALQLNEKLAEAALIRAEELSIDNSFTRPNGTLWYTVLQELNYPAASYNSSIYAGPASADDAFNGWLTSSYAVLTDPDFKYFGVGYYRADTGQKHYWSYFITT
ncbi:MAG: CAP domain-containing protein, partial [Ruminococcus sp.]|nr:CAP domain-containing protein [Ruminococcus sp.]